jgi:hypothetical protein
MQFYRKRETPKPVTTTGYIRKGLWFGVGVFCFVVTILIFAHAVVGMI